jgi:membrane-associated protease RseP (regulator of RpoE activity)
MPIKIDDLAKNPSRTVDSVPAGSPAAQMGLLAGDEILEINGRSVEPHEIPEQILMAGSSPVTLKVSRGGTVMTLGPAAPQLEQGMFRLGFTLRGSGPKPLQLANQPVTRTLADRLRRMVGRAPVAGVRGLV